MMHVSVVLPTKDRPELLLKCLSAILVQRDGIDLEVLVVNDKGVSVRHVLDDPCVRAHADAVVVLEGKGAGPAAARNVGIHAATGDLVFFTDDDAIPQSGWIEAGMRALNADPAVVGVVGRVEAPPFDPLYEHAVENVGGVGNYLTCNVAYRREALVELGGFDERFRFAAGEDRDLGYRMEKLGEVHYVAEMLVHHPARPVSMKVIVRRGRLVDADQLLHRKHPQTRAPRWSTRWGPFVRVVRSWQHSVGSDQQHPLSVQRLTRLVIVAIGQIGVALWQTIVNAFRAEETTDSECLSRRPALRIAWIGPLPEAGGGAAGCAQLLMEELANLDCEIDCYIAMAGVRPEEREPYVRRGVRVITWDTGWRFNRWYSRSGVPSFVTGQVAMAWGRHRLARLLREQHTLHPYDVIYQFSTIELFGLKRHLANLPPLVLHPSTLIAGELRGLRLERAVVARCEPWPRRLCIMLALIVRRKRQQRDIGHAQRVIALSRNLAHALTVDYGVAGEKVVVVPNPVVVNDEPRPNAAGAGLIKIAYVGRISARKGIPELVELSHRLADLAGEVSLDVVGGHTLWSDYRPLLRSLDSRVASYLGACSWQEVQTLLRKSAMLVHPASFEPFGLVVAEALACGTPVVTTDVVGAAEGVDSACCAVVPSGDVDAMEQAVRDMVERIRSGSASQFSAVARSEAKRLFAPASVGRQVFAALVSTMGSKCPPHAVARSAGVGFR